MQQFNPLSLPLQGRILLEASAGTGKTYTLALLFLRLLLERELSIDQVLVVTFTTAATEELRGRIRIRIREALDILKGGKTEDETLRKLVAGVREKNPTRAIVLLEDALTRMDEAAIFTIHGFCQRMLQEHAFESGAPFAMEFLENEQTLRTEIMEDFWRCHFYTCSPEETIWASSLWKTPGKLYNSLGGHLSRPGVQCLPIIDDDELKKTHEHLLPIFARIQSIWREQRDTIADQLRVNKRLSRNNTKGYGEKRLIPALTAMDTFLDTGSMPWLLPELLTLFTRTTIDRSLLKNNHTPPAHQFFVRFDEFYIQHREMTRHRKICILLAAREYLHAELGRRKQQQALLYFDDLLLKMDAALRGPRSEKLTADINKRFPAILVDEFQDTDPLQYHIFSQIHQAHPASTLFLIGDPKQAIYGFRGADIFTYLTARQATPKSNRFTMDKNYRSTEPMVKAVNRLFNRENSFLLAKDAMKFTPVRSAGFADRETLTISGQPMSPLTCLLLPELQTGKPLAKEKANIQAARFCALEITALLERGPEAGKVKLENEPLAGGDIGILVRTHREAETIKAALDNVNIASVYSGKSTVFQSSEAKQMLTLLSVLLNPADPGLARALLATDLFGYNAEQLERLRHEEQEWEEIMATLNQYQHILLQQGFLPMFYSLVARQQNVSRLLAKSSGERTLTNFLHLAELLQEACRRQQGIEQLYRWLVDCIRKPDRQQTDSSQLRLESDENLVKIVTIHKAKGLEYPVVFLPFLWSTRPCSPKKPFSFHHPDRPEQLCVDLGSGSEEHFALAEREQLAADLRLLYVAITRARYSCYFCWGRISKMNETALCRLLHEGELPDQKTLLDDLDRLHSPEAPLIIKSYPENPVLPTPAGSTTEKPLAVTRFTGSIDTSWRITSYSGLTSGHDPRPEQPDYDEQRSLRTQRPGLTVFGFPKGPAAGTCLHAILEKINFTHCADHGTIVAEQLVRAGFKERWQELVTSWMQDILATELEPGCTLNRLEEQDRINEMAFSFPLEDMRLSRFNQVLAAYDIASLPEQQNTLQGLMIGFIDLVFRHKGRYYLADYKSNYLGGSPEDYGQANLRTAMLEHRYDLQYLIYTLALHRFLGSRILDYDYDQHLGGIFYLFLRGMHPNHQPGNGVFLTRPPLALITRLDGCCQGREDADD